MSKIGSFEDLKVWQLARELSKDVYAFSQEEKFSKDYSLKDQINKTAGSIMDNIAEGFERGGNKEFIQFLYIAKGSCGELRSQLIRGLDKKHINDNVFQSATSKANEIGRQLSGFINYLKNSELRGEKYAKEPYESYGSQLDFES